MDRRPPTPPGSLSKTSFPLHHVTVKSLLSFYSFASSFRFFFILALVALLPSVFAQTVAPTNNFPPTPHSSAILIQLGFGIYSHRYLLQPLVPEGYLQDNQSLRGSLHHARANTSTAPDSTTITLISCDPSAYDASFNATTAIAEAIYRAPVAIVLYSDITSGCSLTSGSATTDAYKYIYSMTTSADNGTMFDYAESTGVLIQKRSLFDSNSTSNPNIGNANGPSGPSPSTAVAMIILYSITGVITALFLVIIVTGAVRAHRHPERYGPRNAHGRPRQSRARGLARAMLDTLPIVKFGEKEEDKAPDAEMAAVQSATQAPTSSGSGGVVSQQPKHAVSAEGEGQTVSGAERGEQSTSQEPKESTTPSPLPEENQGCSICTDDFEIGQDVRVLPCTHSFHPACIDPWLLNVSGTCPLCRIDLRPKTAQNQTNLLSPERAERSERNIQGEEVFPPPLDPGADVSRRASRRHSLIWDLLNPSRMRDATPQERIEALRRVREERQLSATEEAEARRRRRISVRLHDVFSIRTAPRPQESGNSIAPVAEEGNSNTVETTNPVN